MTLPTVDGCDNCGKECAPHERPALKWCGEWTATEPLPEWMERKVEIMATKDEQIAELDRRIEEARRREDAAKIECARLEAERATLLGDEETAEFLTAYAEAAAGVPGGHTRFMQVADLQTAKKVMAGKRSLDDYDADKRARVEKVIAELRRAAEESGTPAAEAPPPSAAG